MLQKQVVLTGKFMYGCKAGFDYKIVYSLQIKIFIVKLMGVSVSPNNLQFAIYDSDNF